ncbi:MAG: DUF433 domain-containing protein [Chloroflexota bacterium]
MTKKPTEAIPLTVRDDVILVGNTRVTLDTVVDSFQKGSTPEEIVYQYPSLTLADVYAVLGYYLRHRDEVHQYLAQREAHSARVRRENEDRFPDEGIRQRLLARQRKDNT